MNWFAWLLPAKTAMSHSWVTQINRPTSRVDYHGVCPKWPMKKLLDESPIWNRAKLRKSA